MKRKSTSSKSSTKGIGYINNREEFRELYNSLVSKIGEIANSESSRQDKINKVKTYVDGLVGRSRSSFCGQQAQLRHSKQVLERVRE